MNGIAILLVSALAGDAPGPAAQRHAEAEVVPYRCGELVVIGRFDNLDYEHVEIEDDVLGHGWMTARISVGRVLRGRRPSGSADGQPLPARYFGHTYYREDMDFLLMLAPRRSGTYFVRSARLAEREGPWRLAPHCEAPPDPRSE